MRLLYIADTRLPTEMAHGLQIMKMCEAFTRAGAELELVIPMRFRISELGKKDPFDYYKVERSFKIKKIFCFDLTPLNRFLGPISFLIQALSFSKFTLFYLLFKKGDIIYGRDRFGLFFVSLFKKNVIFEVHKIHRFFFWSILKRVKKIVVITDNLKEILIKKGVDGNKILVAPDGVDLKDFEVKENKEKCREKLNLPLDKNLILYTGHLYKWKGVETLALASRFLSNKELIMVVGGIKWYLSNFRKFVKKNNLKNILISGYQDYSKIPYFLKAVDCLVLTGTETSETSKEYTSPIKMFEYMVSGRPIVASDLPSFREILNENNCVFVKPDNPEAMAEGIKKVLDDSDLAQKLSEQAHKDVQGHTWDNRAKKILGFML